MSPLAYPLPMPVDFPSLFFAGERTALNALGTSPDLRTEVWRQLYLRGSGQRLLDDTLIVPPSEGKVQALVDFLAELKPTSPPEPESTELVVRGLEVFAEARCNACHYPGDTAAHGTATYLRAGPELVPGEDDARPNGSVATSGAIRVWLDGQEAEPLPDGVDPEIAIAAGQALEEREFDWDEFWFQVQRGMVMGDSSGYRVPDLTGLWLTAPYLHNGSVENLNQLLNPDNRQGGGWGLSARGHAFGQQLEGPDKQALIAYLLTL